MVGFVETWHQLKRLSEMQRESNERIGANITFYSTGEPDGHHRRAA